MAASVDRRTEGPIYFSDASHTKSNRNSPENVVCLQPTNRPPTFSWACGCASDPGCKCHAPLALYLVGDGYVAIWTPQSARRIPTMATLC